MPGFKIGGISLGKSTKKYLRNTDFDNNTTMDFGFCQPLFCQFLLPDTNISVSAKQLVRLAPMPVPSFARVSLVNKFVFVPWADICDYYEAMLSNMPYNGSVVPTQLPFTYNAYLAMSLLLKQMGTIVSFYDEDSTVTSPVTYKLCDIAGATTYSNTLSDSWKSVLGSHTCILNVQFTPKQDPDSSVSPNNADYVYKFQVNKKSVIAAFRYSTRAKHLRSVLIGLGYSLAFLDWTKVNALPIFAYYKAWFDTYAPKRSTSWTDTGVFKFIKNTSEKYLPNVSNAADFSSVVLTGLSECYYVSNDDFVSVHRSTMDNVSIGSFPYVNVEGSLSSTNPRSSTEQPNISTNYVSLIALDVVKRLTRFVNKDSIIGQKMSAWVRNHFNAQVANSLYQDVYQIKTDILPLQINDVFSTADTADSSNQSGERLGSYAGKGIGFGETGCRFHSDKHGYLLCISAIVPKSGYFQGTDSSLYGLDRFTLPSSDFDALGMEVSPLGFVAGDNGFTDAQPYYTNLDYSSGFGYVPRYSGYKFKKNIVNGDMSRRSLIDSMCPYYLDRILQTGDVLFETLPDNKYSLKNRFIPSIPRASEQWRFISKYPWLGDFDRIFYNDDVYHGSNSIPAMTPIDDIGVFPARPDNFIVQSLFTMKIQDVLKPLSMSYDTFDEDSDNTSSEVNPE